MSSNDNYYKKNSTSDAMSEYHRDQQARWENTKPVQGPRKEFGSWDGNKERKDYYRFAHHQTNPNVQAKGHKTEKEKWYNVRSS